VRISLAVALLFGAAFALLTPPFQVPDEVGHYYRACAIAHGGFWPPVLNGHGYTAVPIGSRELVSDHDVPFVPELAYVKYPIVFSPLPFLPQALGCAIGDALHLRPLVTFYLARLMNLVCALAMVLLAARIAAPWLVIAPALLPMSLFLFGSLSPDALTIAMTFLATTLALAGSPWVIAAAAALALCKPGYLLVPLLVFATRRRIGATIGATVVAVIAAGAFVSTLFIKTKWAFLRPGVDDRAQLRFALHHPNRAGSALAADLVRHGVDRLEQLVGRLGLLTIPIPTISVVLALALLVAVALFAAPRVSTSQRVLAAIIAVATIGAVELSQYISWTAVGAKEVEGVQGRYFIPIVPLLLLAISRPNERARWPASVVPVVMTFVNATALWAVYRA
jgi:uncharacterized membrane protein